MPSRFQISITAAVKKRRKEIELRIEQKAKYADNIFVLISIYLIAVFILLLLAGHDCNGFTLTSGVLMMILGTTTTTVLGLVYVIVRHLFPPERIDTSSPSPKEGDRKSLKEKALVT